MAEIAKVTQEKVNALRENKNTEIQKTVRMLNLFPSLVIRFLLFLSSFIGYTLNIKPIGIPEDAFGAFMISNVGSLGLDIAYAPLVPYSRVPMVIIIGAAKKRPVVIDGEIKIREIVKLSLTIDHRFCDGALGAKMARELHQVFEHPGEYF